MVHRKFIATITAAAIAVTGLTAAPARADSNDTAKIIAGVAALAIIGTVIAKNNRNKRNRASRNSNYNDGFYGQRTRRNDGTYYDDGFRRNRDRFDDDSYNRPLPRRAQRKILPRSCKVQARTRNGRVPAYGSRCLQNNFRYASSLPRRCAFKARTKRSDRRRIVYGRNCLANHGYRPGNY